MKKELEAKDRLLNLFIDGEMTSDKAADYRTEVLAHDLDAQREHQDLLSVRREIRNYSAEQTSKFLAKTNSEQLWQRIEKEISKEQEFELPWWRKLFVPAISFATAVAIAFVIGVQFGTQKNNVNYAALNKSSLTKGSDNNFNFRLKAHENGFQHEIIVAANKDGVLHRVPIELDSNQLIGVSKNIPLRAQGIDIDWIKSDRQYQLVGKSVPVIWVTKKKQ